VFSKKAFSFQLLAPFMGIYVCFPKKLSASGSLNGYLCVFPKKAFGFLLLAPFMGIYVCFPKKAFGFLLSASCSLNGIYVCFKLCHCGTAFPELVSGKKPHTVQGEQLITNMAITQKPE
jgi:hypothetical protein